MQEASPRWELKPDTLLGDGKYRVVRLLGAGGMGSVYEAVHRDTDKRFAIKWMHPQPLESSGSARLVREAQAAARVNHRNAVDIYDIGRDGDTVFLVMEYLEGEPLSRALARGMPMHRLIALLLPAMRAVLSGHKQGVVHRDIKPDNIFLARKEGEPDVVPKVLDFGISKVDLGDTAAAPITRTGGVLGTPRYMSLEQLSGARDIDGRTDVYAFGVILYEALTGQPPFPARSFLELSVKVATATPADPKTLRPEVPSTLSAIVLWALARNRADRIGSLEALIAELTPFATEAGFSREQTVVLDAPLTALPVPSTRVSEVREASSSIAALDTSHPLSTGGSSASISLLGRSPSAVLTRPVIFTAIALVVVASSAMLLWLRAPPAAPQLGTILAPSATQPVPEPASHSETLPMKAVEERREPGALNVDARPSESSPSRPVPRSPALPAKRKVSTSLRSSDARKNSLPPAQERVAADTASAAAAPQPSPSIPSSPSPTKTKAEDGHRVETLPTPDQF